MGFRPAGSIVLSLALACVAAAQTQGPETTRARRLLLEALAAVPGRSVNQSRQSSLLASIASAQARAGDIDGALATARRSGDDATQALVQAGEKLAVTTPERLTRLANGLSDSQRMTFLAGFAAGQARKGEVRAAIRTAQSITDPATKADVMRTIAAEQSRAGDTAAATATLEQYLTHEPRENQHIRDERVQEEIAEVDIALGRFDTARAIAQQLGASRELVLVALASAEAKAGQQSAARSDLHNALPLLEKTAADAHRDFEAYFVLGAFAAAGDFEQARQLADSIGTDYLHNDALATIAVFQAEQGKSADARKTIEQISTTGSDGADSSGERERRLLALARAQTNSGDCKDAQETLAAVTDSSMTEDRAFESAYTSAHCAKYAAGWDMALKTESNDTSAELVRLVAASEAHAGNIDDALARARALPRGVLRAAALLGVAQGLLGEASLPTVEYFTE